MFVNRVSELDLLEKRYRSDKAEFFVLYGRRRVGKTELLRRFCEGKRNVFFVSDLGSELSLRTALSNAVNKVLHEPYQSEVVYSNWDGLFQVLGQAAQQERLVVVLDEFPYMVSAHPPLASILQRTWDHTLKDTRIMLILCGSYIGMMEESVLGYQAPLYGRRTAQYLLEPLRFKDARSFFNSFSNEDQVRAYSVYGGAPAYLNLINPRLTIQENILEGILSRGAFLYDEVRLLLQQELREPRYYFAILQAIAGGKTRQNEIKQATGIESVTAYLDVLQQLHWVERIVPVTENQPYKSRRGLYRLKDHYLRFWFRYVLPNRSLLEQGESQNVLQREVIPQLDHFSSLAFEEICQQYLWQLGLTNKLPFQPNDIGRWWKANEEIDLVVLGEQDAMLVECKWTGKPIGVDVLADLERKVLTIKAELGERRIRYALCARSGFTPQMIAESSHRADLTLLELPEIIGG